MSNLWSLIIGIIMVVGVTACSNYIVSDVMQDNQLTEPKAIAKDEGISQCLSKIKRAIDIKQNKAPSTAKVELVEYETFNNKDNAIEYTRLWEEDKLGGGKTSEKALSDLNNLGYDAKIFIAIMKVEFQSDLTLAFYAFTWPLVCSNNTILPNSMELLTS